MSACMVESKYERIEQAFMVSDEGQALPRGEAVGVYFERGGYIVVVLATGRTFAVVEETPGIDGLGFELIAEVDAPILGDDIDAY